MISCNNTARRRTWRAYMATTHSENDRRIDYVEFNVADVASAKKFYGEAFGWSFRDFGPDYIASSGTVG